MQIAYDYQIFCLQNVGGISRYFIELARKLPAIFPDILTTSIAPLHINEYLGNASIKKIGLQVQSFPGKHHLIPLINATVSPFIIRSLRPDILHETYYSHHGLAFDGPRILTVYDMIHERFPDQFHGPDTMVASLKATAVARADHVIAISKSTRDDLIHFLQVPEEKITVIPLASSFSGDVAAKKTVYRDKPYLLYVGVRKGVKNFKTLVTAFAASSLLRAEYDLLCVGGGKFEHQETEYLQKMKVRKSVQHVQADDNMLAMLYSHATLFVYPSLYEGFGIPLLEAMRCGCPVACSNSSSMPEIAGDAAVFFDPEDSEDICNVIEETIKSDTLRTTLIERGRKREQLYNWDTCVTQTAEVYHDVL